MKIFLVLLCLFLLGVGIQSCSKKDDPSVTGGVPKIGFLFDDKEMEGDILVFEVHMDTTFKDTVSFYYYIEDVTTTPSDYTAPSGKKRVTISPWQTAAVITIPTILDTLTETDETFNIVLSDPKNCTIGTAYANGKILDFETYTHASKYFMTAKINGAEWTTLLHGFFGAQLFGKEISSDGNDLDSEFTFVFFQSPMEVKTYGMERGHPSSNANIAAFYSPHYFSQRPNVTTYNGDPTAGEFKITAYDAVNKTVSGSFKFTCSDGNGNSIRVTDGSFKIPYKE